MLGLKRQEMYFGKFFTLDELVESIEAVTAADVQRIAQTLFRSPADRAHHSQKPRKPADQPRSSRLLSYGLFNRGVFGAELVNYS